MTKRKNIMIFWKEFNPSSDKSIQEDFEKESYPSSDKIAAYLDQGKVTLVSAECGKDVITNERIVDTICILTDGEYSWLNTLGYYVRNYHLRLPLEFEKSILNKL